ncbi:uncharacterized protein DS421_1g24920 [Arachis hypogaea]|nr:uncharacterized protein DS421_1g24920 [Arachis hypogaea]
MKPCVSLPLITNLMTTWPSIKSMSEFKMTQQFFWRQHPTYFGEYYDIIMNSFEEMSKKVFNEDMIGGSNNKVVILLAYMLY